MDKWDDEEKRRDEFTNESLWKKIDDMCNDVEDLTKKILIYIKTVDDLADWIMKLEREQVKLKKEIENKIGNGSP